LRWVDFSALMFIRSTALSITTKLSAELETPPIANLLLCIYPYTDIVLTNMQGENLNFILIYFESPLTMLVLRVSA